MKFMSKNRDKYLIKILVFLFLIVLLFTVSITTRTKYVSYLNTYSAATAGEFYFGSNYLGSESENVTYTISSWNRLNYSITIQLRSYENSLLYNDSDVDFYYKVDATMYTDEACTVESSVFKPTITYPSDVETVTIDGETYAYFEGTGYFDVSECKQNVVVDMQGTAYATTTQYLKITADTYPVLKESTDPDSTETITINDHTIGVFHSTLDATFILQNSSGEATVTSTLKQNSANSEVQLIITCSEITGATSQKLRIYFDNTLLEADSMTLPGVQVWSENSKYSYAEIDVNALSVTTALLMKKEVATIVLGTSLEDITNGTAHVYVEEISS